MNFSANSALETYRIFTHGDKNILSTCGINSLETASLVN